MTDRRLQIFCTVADKLSFSRAARVLGISQPAVTQNIALMEAELGCALFLRVSNNVILTEKGEELLSIAREILTLYSRIDNLK